LALPQNLWGKKYNILLSLDKQSSSFPHAFGGVMAHGCAVYESKDGNPVKQLIQFILYQHLYKGLRIYPDSSFSMDSCQKNAGMTIFLPAFPVNS
jgi:hypothetical protein